MKTRKIMVLVCLLSLISAVFMACDSDAEAYVQMEETTDTETQSDESSLEETTAAQNDEELTVEETTEAETEESEEWITIAVESFYRPSIQVWKSGFDIHLNQRADKTFEPERPSVSMDISDEKTVTGVYDHRVESPHYRDSYLIYRVSGENGDSARFDLAEDTGRLVRYMDFEFDRKVEDGTINGPILPKEECIAIAQKYMYDFLGASGNYVLVNEQYTKDPDSTYGTYTFHFRRYMDQLPTDEHMLLSMGEMGVIKGFSSKMLGGMDDIDLLDYDEEELMKAIGYKLARIYAMRLAHTVGQYLIDDVCLTRLQDGELYLQYRLTVRFVSQETVSPEEEVSLLVCIGSY